MALLIEAICVVVRVDAIKRKFVGGVDGFMRTLPNGALCVDNWLARLAFMAPREAVEYIAHLERSGLRFVKDDKAFDIVIVDQTQGPTAPCDWLEFSRTPYKSAEGVVGGLLSVVSYKGLPGHPLEPVEVELSPTALVTPPDWQYAGSMSEKSVTVSQGEVSERMKYLRSEGNMSIFLDTQSGEEVGILRSNLPG